MRTSEEMKNLIVQVALADPRIRAVWLTGSRADSNIEADKWQDFDIVFVVQHLDSFTSDHTWTDVFGEKTISQLPDEMETEIAVPRNSSIFHYLMLFNDGNRIDLTLIAAEEFVHFHMKGAAIAWLDKDNLSQAIKANDPYYFIKKPTEKQFLDSCNEFWWVVTYVAKGLMRQEITYSKEMMECYVRPMFMKIVEWYVGVETQFSVEFGKAGRFMQKHLDDDKYKKILATYSDSDRERTWQALFLMMEIFSEFANVVARQLGFDYKMHEQVNVTRYLMELHGETNVRREA